MTATEVLRRMLDERGVEHYDGTECTLWLRDGVGYRASADELANGRMSLYMLCETPEQAIAATLGRSECHNASKVMDEHGQARFACSECGAWIDSRMLWNPEYRNGESPWVSGCRLNYCPNCGRRIVDPTTNDVDAEVTNG